MAEPKNHKKSPLLSGEDSAAALEAQIDLEQRVRDPIRRCLDLIENGVSWIVQRLWSGVKYLFRKWNFKEGKPAKLLPEQPPEQVEFRDSQYTPNELIKFKQKMHNHKVPLIPKTNPSAPSVQQHGDVEALIEARAEARFQLRMLPMLALPMGVTAYFAYVRASELGPAWFALHPTSELTALIAMVSSVLVGKLQGPEHGWKQNFFSFVSWLAASFGFYIVFTVKQQYHKPHFVTPHSHLGAITFLLIMAYTIISLVAFHPNRGPQRNNERAQKIHSNLGRMIVVLGLLTASAGIMELEVLMVPNVVIWIGSLACFVPLIV
jgi:hypothetical protein